MSMSNSSTVATSVTSNTSTDEYGHEPFETYQKRVGRLVTERLWPGTSPDDITVSRMPSGGYNRVVAFDIKRPEDAETSYVLRVPRWEKADLANEYATLRFVRDYTTIPAPDIVSMDESTNNHLEDRYTVQTRSPGEQLLSKYTQLDHSDRKEVARAVGLIYRHLLNTRSETPGRIYLLPEHNQHALHLSPSAPYYI